MSKNYKKNEQTVLGIIITGLFRVLWWIIKLPFIGFKIKKGKRISVQERNYITKRRLEIESRLRSDNDSELKQLVIEADKLIDYALQASGYTGLTFADRLRSAESSIPNGIYNEIWQGHKVRNQIAHEHDLVISKQELNEAIRKLLKYLKVFN